MPGWVRLHGGLILHRSGAGDKYSAMTDPLCFPGNLHKGSVWAHNNGDNDDDRAAGNPEVPSNHHNNDIDNADGSNSS